MFRKSFPPSVEIFLLSLGFVVAAIVIGGDIYHFLYLNWDETMASADNDDIFLNDPVSLMIVVPSIMAGSLALAVGQRFLISFAAALITASLIGTLVILFSVLF